jgi:DNA polymerase-4/protein ImuB
MDSSPEVEGVTAGMPVREASARCRDAIAVQADEPYYRRVFDSLAVALSRRSPSVEQASNMPGTQGQGAPGTLYVGLSGLGRLYGGDAAAAAALLHAIPYDLGARVGVADGKFPAYVAATMTEPGRASRVTDDTASFLQGASVDLLPVTWDAKVRLHRFGLHTLGDVANLGPGPMQAQFGRDGRAAWELASGIDARVVVSYKAEEEIVEELTFPAPATSMNMLLLGTDLLLGRAFARPGLRGKYVRTASLHGSVSGRTPWTRSIAFKDAVGSRDLAMTAMKGALAGTALPGALEDLRLTLSGLTGESGIQSSLFADVRRQEQLRETMRQLARRLRARPPVYRVREVEPWSRIPERRQALVHFDP